MRARARAGTAAAAASAAVGGAKAKPAKPKPKYSADDHNRPDGVRWSDLPSGTAVMVSGNCPGVAAEPGEVVPATICDGSEQEMHPVTRDGQVSIAGGVFPNRDGRKLWIPFKYVVRVGHDLATESHDSRPRRQCSTPSPMRPRSCWRAPCRRAHRAAAHQLTAAAAALRALISCAHTVTRR
eukprot:COSAG06_NODE_5512_length_3435_cov_1.399580_2_plen_182_part_00